MTLSVQFAGCGDAFGSGGRFQTCFVARWEEVVYDTVAAHGGRVVKTIGDEAMFVGLSSAVAGIAIALRDAAAGHGLPPVRTGLAAGMVVARDGDFYGPVVNLAARLVGVARPGEVLADEAAARLASDGGYRVDDAGTFDLKGFDEPVPALRIRR